MAGKETVVDDVICLVRREFSETSQVLVFMSRENGKVSLLAKGVKRPRGKTAGGIDILDAGQARYLASPEGLGLLQEFLPGPGKPWLEIRNDLKKWYAAMYLAEVANISTKEMEPARAVYDILHAAMDRVSEAKTNAQLAEVLVGALAELLGAIGYQPQVRTCTNCKREMTPNDILYFSASGGGLVCRDCEPAMLDKIRIEHRAWSYLLGKVRDVVSAGKAFDVLNYMLREHLERGVTMLAYCREIFQPDGGEKKINSVPS